MKGSGARAATVLANSRVHERLLGAISSVGSALAHPADYEQALRSLTESMCRIVDAENGGVMVYDEERDELVLQKPGFGVQTDEIVSCYRVPIAEGGNAVRVFLTQTSYIANEPRKDPRFIQRFVQLFDTWSTVTVPLRVGNQPIGVFHVINKRSGAFTDADRAILEHLAPLLAAGVQAARSFLRVQEEQRRLERAVVVHREMCRAMFEGRGLDPLCKTFAALVGRPVAVFDVRHQLLAWSGARDAPTIDALRARLATAGEHARAVTPIRMGDELGGYLVVGGAADDGLDDNVVKSAASMFAVALLAERTAFERKRHTMRELMEQLVEGAALDPSAILRRLGCPSPPWSAVSVVVEARSDAAAPRALRVTPELDRRLAAAFAGAGLRGPLAPWGHGFVAILDRSEVARLRDGDLAERILAALSAAPRDAGSRMGLRWGVGTPAASLEGLGASITTSEQAMVAAERLAIHSRPVFYDDLGVYRLLLSHDPVRDQADFVEHVLGAVRIAGEKKHCGKLFETLEALVDNGFKLPLTAERLGVHVNTLKYRVRRLHELLGGDPARGELRLEVELAMRIARLQAPRGTVS